MGTSGKLVWKIYVTVLGIVTTLAAHKLVTFAWQKATGDEPPTPSDPESPVSQAVLWSLMSGLGIGITQLLTQRFAARRWQHQMGTKPPTATKIILRM